MAKRPRSNDAEKMMAAALDKRSLLDDINKALLPILAKAVKECWTTEQWRAHPVLSSLINARQVSIAISDPDAGKALAAIRDLNDRIEGKPKERVENTHRLEKAPDEQLDAKLASLLETTHAAEKH